MVLLDMVVLVAVTITLLMVVMEQLVVLVVDTKEVVFQMILILIWWQVLWILMQVPAVGMLGNMLILVDCINPWWMILVSMLVLLVPDQPLGNPTLIQLTMLPQHSTANTNTTPPIPYPSKNKSRPFSPERRCSPPSKPLRNRTSNLPRPFWPA